MRSPYLVILGGALAGRVGELQAVSRVLSGQADAAALLVVGEAGVGKSRLLAAAAEQVAGEGVLVLPGWCLVMSAGLPLLPVAEMLDALERADGALLESVLKDCPPYVRPELVRLLPDLDEADLLGSARSASVPGSDESWRRQRLFQAIRRLLGEVNDRRPIAVVIEDLHWADAATLEFVEFLAAPSSAIGVPLVVCCRSEEAISPAVTQWLERAQRNPRVHRLELAALTRAETGEQIELLTGSRPDPADVERTYARSDGNAFFTEQLVSAAMHGAKTDTLPAGLTSLLLARTAALPEAAREIIETLAVAGRPLDEAELVTVCGHAAADVRAALRRLVADRLLRRPDQAGGHQLRHALLGEAVAADLLPSQQRQLHSALADLLTATADDSLAGEIADHLRAAGRPGDELQWRIAAARRAETLFAVHDAADQWLRALDLWKRAPSDSTVEGMSLLDVYGAAEDALDAAGRQTESRDLAQQALARYATSDRASRAEALRRAGGALTRSGDERGVGLLRDAIDLYEQLPPSGGFVRALHDLYFVLSNGGHPRQANVVLQRAADVADQAGARAERLRILSQLAANDVGDASVDQIVSIRAQLTETDPPELHAYLAAVHTFILSCLGRRAEIRQIGLPAIERAAKHGVAESRVGAALYLNVAESLLELGEVHEAALFIDPITDREVGPVRQATLFTHAARAQLDMLRGAATAASRRWVDIRAIPTPSLAIEADTVRWEIEFQIWEGDHRTALQGARAMLQRLASAVGGIAVDEFLMGACTLLVLGQRAVADLAEQGRAQHSEQAIADSRDAAADLDAVRERIQPRPFGADDPRLEAPAEMWQWRAEQSRAGNGSDATLWGRAAGAWEKLGRPHRAAYARWRQAEALLATPDGRPAAVPILRRAAEQAAQHAPLTAVIADLARRARVNLTPTPPAATTEHSTVDQHPAAFNLTDRELSVLRLLAQGKTNAEIGATLFISHKTASVHVTNILRKLGVASRVQAAAVAERAGLLTPRKEPSTISPHP
jgi:DNA-binding CsgD family transcriptional regulator